MTDRQYGAKHPIDPEAATQPGGLTPGQGPDVGLGSAWLVNVSGTDTVEMTRAEIAQAWTSGHLSEATLVWRQGMGEWAPLGAVPQLAIDFERGALAHRGDAAESSLRSDQDASMMSASAGQRLDAYNVDPAFIDGEAPDQFVYEQSAPPDAGLHAAFAVPAPEQDAEISEDEVIEVWEADEQVSDAGAVQSAHLYANADPATEQLPEDEVTELWGQQATGEEPSLSFGYSELDAEDLPEDEVTELLGRCLREMVTTNTSMVVRLMWPPCRAMTRGCRRTKSPRCTRTGCLIQSSASTGSTSARPFASTRRARQRRLPWRSG
jgi:hypothetical protein